LNVKLSFAVVLLVLLLVVSCGKKSVKTDPGTQDDTAAVTEPVEDTTEPVDAVIEMDTNENEDMAVDAQVDTAVEDAAALAKEEFQSVSIYFDYDSYSILPSEEAKLQANADWMKENSSVQVIIEGHCDERGTTEYNLALGDRRAAKVKNFLENLGIDGAMITTVTYGEEKPVASGHNEEAWSKNRRAAFVIQ
jgi:peptidoglycan-associated lipoprotein